jgi:hypothetical protein
VDKVGKEEGYRLLWEETAETVAKFNGNYTEVMITTCFREDQKKK